MAKRQRSQDGTRDTDAYVQSDTPSQQGRAGGDLARRIGTRDALKHADAEAKRTPTRVRKSDERRSQDG